MLWKWQLQLSKQALLLYVISLIAITWWGLYSADEFRIPFVFLLASILLSNRLHFLKQAQYHMLLHTMPIARATLVRSIFSFSLALIFLLLLLFVPLQLSLSASYLYLVLMSASFSVVVLSTAVQHHFILTDVEYNMSSTAATFSTVLSLLAVAISQLLISSFLPIPLFAELLLLPIVTLTLYYVIMQMTVKDYEKRISY